EGSLALAGSSPLRQVLADVSRFETARFAPVRVPVRTVGAARASALSASHVLEPVGDLRVLVPLGLGKVRSLAIQQEPPDEDHQPSQIVLVQRAYLPDERPVDRHPLLLYTCT